MPMRSATLRTEKRGSPARSASRRERRKEPSVSICVLYTTHYTVSKRPLPRGMRVSPLANRPATGKKRPEIRAPDVPGHDRDHVARGAHEQVHLRMACNRLPIAEPPPRRDGSPGC